MTGPVSNWQAMDDPYRRVKSRLTILSLDDVWDRVTEILNAHPELVRFDNQDDVEVCMGRVAADRFAALESYAWLLGSEQS